jgi:hypothetical protein
MTRLDGHFTNDVVFILYPLRGGHLIALSIGIIILIVVVVVFVVVVDLLLVIQSSDTRGTLAGGCVGHGRGGRVDRLLSGITPVARSGLGFSVINVPLGGEESV